MKRHLLRLRRSSVDPTGPPGRLRSFLIQFLRTESGGGAILLAATVLALVLANGPLSSTYEDLWTATLSFSRPAWLLLDVRHWVNEGLMALFFFLVGLEIKREFTRGELRDRKQAALPLVGAVGGMMLPAGIYLLVNAGGDLRGWPIPMATDIAFAIGLVALLGRLVPLPIKLFILTLAIADDLGAVVVVAIAAPETIRITWLLALLVCVGVAILSKVLWIRSLWTIAAVGILMWFLTLRSGVHPTIAGVALAFMIPSGPPLIERLERALHPWSSFVILPLFAFANAGVDLSPLFSNAFQSPITVGIALGMVVGKTVGIFGAAWLSIRFRLARLPPGVRGIQLLGAAAICGVGFTVSLFMAALSFEGKMLANAKIGILVGSVLSAVLGSLILWSSRDRIRRTIVSS